MYLQILKNISNSKRLRKADIARLAEVSRATVTQWFSKGEKTGWVNVESKTLLRLAQGLGVPANLFLEERIPLNQFQTEFLWDRLYPNMESFTQALIQKRLPALARLVQVLGFHNALKITGKSTIKLFEKYKKYMKPVRRKELEILWPLYH